MKITNDQLLALTADMPCKAIEVGVKPYLERYYAGTFVDGKDLWLHRFLSADGDRHLHNHPFEFTSVMLSGGYLEETPTDCEWHYAKPCISVAMFDIALHQIAQGGEIHSDSIPMLFNNSRKIGPFDWHRIDRVLPETWTACLVDPRRLPFWYFRDDDGHLESVESSPRDWWRAFGVRV